jgi:hypothetical protein
MKCADAIATMRVDAKSIRTDRTRVVGAWLREDYIGVNNTRYGPQEDQELSLHLRHFGTDIPCGVLMSYLEDLVLFEGFP